MVAMSSMSAVVAGCDDIGPYAALDQARWEVPCTTSPNGSLCGVSPVADRVLVLTGSGWADVTLRFRGELEQKTYAGGTVDGYFNTGGHNGGDGFNVYALTVSSPAQTYFINAGRSGIYNTFAIDYTETISIDGDATVRLHIDNIDGLMVSNRDPNGVPLVVPGVPPDPAAYAGQFAEVSVVSAAMH